MNSEVSRKTNFKLGDFKNYYSTTTNDQNQFVVNGRAISINNNKESHVKNDLRKSHFILGNFEPNFKTISQTEFYDKSKLQNSTHGKSMEKQLRDHNYILGNSIPDYKSETHSKFLIPSMQGRSQQTISSHDLQKSHHVFGNYENPWSTTNHSSFYPKEIDNKRISKDLTRTNFVLGEDKPDLKSISQNTYVPHGYVQNEGTKERCNDIRRNDNPDMISINRQDYIDAKNRTNSNSGTGAGNKFNPNFSEIDPQFLRTSHFQLGDKSQMPPDQWATTYGQTMQPNPIKIDDRKSNNSFKSSICINPDGDQTNFQTESRINYNYKTNNITKEEIKNIKTLIGHIRGHNFALGNDKNDFSTTTAATYKFDPVNASKSKGQLDSKLIDDLRATHYKIGFMNDQLQTTHQSSYLPIQLYKKSLNNNVIRNEFNLNQTNRNVFDAKSMYMVDYTKKEATEKE